MITEKTTAGIFSMRTMELIPIAMEQHPKIMLVFSLKSSVRRFPVREPMSPPAATERTLTMTPIGIDDYP